MIGQNNPGNEFTIQSIVNFMHCIQENPGVFNEDWISVICHMGQENNIIFSKKSPDISHKRILMIP